MNGVPRGYSGICGKEILRPDHIRRYNRKHILNKTETFPHVDKEGPGRYI